MQKIECTALPLALWQHEYYTGLWLNEDTTFPSVARIDDFPGVIPAEIKTKLKKGIHEIDSLPEPELIQDRDGMPLFVYWVENDVFTPRAFEKQLVDAALLAGNSKMYVYSEKGPLLVEHEEGFYLIAPVTLEIISRVSFV